MLYKKKKKKNKFFWQILNLLRPKKKLDLVEELLSHLFTFSLSLSLSLSLSAYLSVCLSLHSSKVPLFDHPLFLSFFFFFFFFEIPLFLPFFLLSAPTFPICYPLIHSLYLSVLINDCQYIFKSLAMVLIRQNL
jgi:hypothetical protein